ncbi:MAG TPA: MATE family efflux transporter [Methanobacterium sp.]|nr:MAG: MATE family efflux transporter [Methanobacterium sp.]HOI72229.1 MATE family efflux transporter [Methanobacterium sp.]HPX78020.1 MATE family efflux transporter [Methanobacterium sp.]
MNSSNKQSSDIDQRIAMVTGDPKRAIRVLSVPMIISMLLIMSYNLADSIWVAGLGPNAIAALGFTAPIFMLVTGLGNGLGAGATSLIARCIGAVNKQKADNAAMHAIILAIVVSVILTIVLWISLPFILQAVGAGSTIGLALEYGEVVFGGLIFLIFSSVASGILRAEGDVNRPMYAVAVTTILNVILDPIFIYYFGWGIAGAAWATILSSSISCAIMIYWMIIKRDTYVKFSRKGFKADWNVTGNILTVGLPASAESFVMSILGVFLNLILVVTGGTEAVAVYTAGWRVVMMVMILPIGIGTATITVAGAAFGARKYDNLKTALTYSTKLGLTISIVVGLLLYIFSGFIAAVFTYSPQTANLAPEIAAFIQVMFLFFIPIQMGISASSVFQGMGKGLTSLVLTVLRELAFIAVFAYLFAFIFNFGTHGVWWGLVVGNAIGCILAYAWVNMYLKRLKRYL